MSVDSTQFFEHIDAFFDYRQTIYQASEQTIKSNQVDLNLFRSFVQDSPFDTISGPAVMQFQYHLKNERNNCGGSINRKIFTLRSYAHFLSLSDVPGADA
jgi:site-specific recombinase XerD